MRCKSESEEQELLREILRDMAQTDNALKAELKEVEIEEEIDFIHNDNTSILDIFNQFDSIRSNIEQPLKKQEIKSNLYNMKVQREYVAGYIK